MERPLGVLEKAFAISAENRLATVVAVSAEYSVPLTKQNLYPALIQLIKEEPLLCCNVFVHKKKKYSLAKNAAVDLNDVVAFYPSIPFGEEYVNNELFPDGRDPLPYNEKRLPLWRIDVLGTSELVWLFDHSIFDGTSAVLFHRKLLRCLREVHKTRRPSYISSPEEDVGSIARGGRLPLPQPIEKKAKVRLPIKAFLKMLFEELINATKGKNTPLKYKKHIVYADPPPMCPMSAKVVLLQLSAGQIRALKAKAKEHGVKLTAMFYSALTQALMLQLPPDKLSAEKGLAFFTDIPINARPLAYQPDKTKEEMGNLVFLHEYRHALPTYLDDKTAFKPQWAKDFQASLNGTKPKPGKVSPASHPIAALKFANIKKLVTKKLMKRRGCIAEISNLGLASFDNETRVENSYELSRRSMSTDMSSPRSPVFDSNIPEITNVTFLQDGYSFSAAVTMSIVGLERSGNVNVSITVSGDDENSSMAKRIRDAFSSILESATPSSTEVSPAEPILEKFEDDNVYSTPTI